MNKLFILGALLCMAFSLNAQYNDNEVSLKGRWKFSIGDNKEWASPSYDDADWDLVEVPDTWEDQGYNGYDSYAWYRKKFWIPESFSDRSITIELGYIDDVDEVFLNGVKIGQTGSFPPNYSSAYSSLRKYSIPSSLINVGKENYLAVRVYDAQIEGGITKGNIRLIAGDIVVKPDIDMAGEWNFRIRSSSRKMTIIVPGKWENQGLNNYDGIATYSRIVEVPEAMANKKLIFMAGRIDDDDEFYVNGELVARSGYADGSYYSDMYKEFRNYFIPHGVIKPGKNLIEIKVIDHSGEGGIMEGSVGLITQDNFIKYWRMRRQN